jgi:hypothetical protein
MRMDRKREPTPPSRHVPNHVPLSTRVQLAVLAAGLLLYLCAALAIGHTYIPGKRGGVVIGGTGTLLVVLAVAALSMAALLKIVDHYDRRHNEALYSTLCMWLLKAGLGLLIAGPLIAVLLGMLGLDPARGFQGFAGDATWHSPELREYAPRVRVVLDQSLWIGAVSLLALLLALLLGKMLPARKRLVAWSGTVALLGFGLLVLGYTLEDFLLGEVVLRRRPTIYAAQHPNVFNAVLLTRGLCGALLLGVGVALGWMAASRKALD